MYFRRKRKICCASMREGESLALSLPCDVAWNSGLLTRKHKGLSVSHTCCSDLGKFFRLPRFGVDDQMEWIFFDPLAHWLKNWQGILPVILYISLIDEIHDLANIIEICPQSWFVQAWSHGLCQKCLGRTLPCWPFVLHLLTLWSTPTPIDELDLVEKPYLNPMAQQLTAERLTEYTAQ